MPGEFVQSYRVEVSSSLFGQGTCNVPECNEWGTTIVTFRDVAGFACSKDHVLGAAVCLVRARIRRNVVRFRVETFTARYERIESTLALSDPIDRSTGLEEAGPNCGDG